jgi:hypothetical protein
MARPAVLAVLLAVAAVLLPGSTTVAAQPLADAPYFVNSLQCPELETVVEVTPAVSRQ